MSINTIYQTIQKISNAAKVSEQELMETQDVLGPMGRYGGHLGMLGRLLG